MSAPWIVRLDDPAAADPAAVGGKAAGLHRLVALGARVPAGFVVSTAAFTAALDDAALRRVEAPLRDLAPGAPLDALERAAAQARAELLDATGAGPVLDAVRAAYDALGGEVAVRSSAAAEDAAEASFAGEHDSYLELRGADAVADAVRRCWASLYTARAVSYRELRPGPGSRSGEHGSRSGEPGSRSGQPGSRSGEHGPRGGEPGSRSGEPVPGDVARSAGAMAVVVQRMVAARAAGVFMTLNPANGDRSTLVCEAVWGLGEPVVSGEVTPDRFVVDKVSGDVVRREIAVKPTRLVRSPAGGTAVEDVPPAQRDLACLADPELAELLRVGRALERAAGTPQDGEFAVDAEGVHLLQARPETVWARRARRAVAPGRTAMAAVLATLTGATPRSAAPGSAADPGDRHGD